MQALGQVLEPSNLHFSIFFGVSQHKSQKCSSCNKTTIFAMFYRLWNMSHTATERVFCIAFRAWLDMVHGLLQKIPAGIHFLLFATTLQRGGTCEAHPPPPEGMPCVPDIKHWVLLCCLPLRPAFKIRLQIPSSKAFPHPFAPSPGLARTAQPSQKLREILF